MNIEEAGFELTRISVARYEAGQVCVVEQIDCRLSQEDRRTVSANVWFLCDPEPVELEFQMRVPMPQDFDVKQLGDEIRRVPSQREH